MDAELQRWINALGPDRWAGFVLNARDELVWVSDELKEFLGEHDETKLGIGQNFVAAFLSPVWLDAIAERDQLEIFTTAIPMFRADMSDDVLDVIPTPFRDLLVEVEPQPRQPVIAGSFEYQQHGLPQYRVEYLLVEVRDVTGSRVGSVGITNQGLRPTLLSLLSRGDTAMYERMARLVVPARRAATILFADLEASGELSRRLPTSRYFQVIRDLTTQFDATVAEECGIVGKHVGDGMTAFFLTDDLGTPSRASAAAIRTARAMHVVAESLEVRLRVGAHWGPNLYLGQLVPGGRLDVTALGDAVNECARVQELAQPREVLATKQLVELLDPPDAAELSIDPEQVTYQPLAQLPGASAKALRDAATLAVTNLASS